MFQPIVVGSGLTAWSFLQRTMDTQTQAFNKSPELQRDAEYFAENIGNVKTADDLVGDYRLLKVALGAFGLEDDIYNKAFIKQVLDEGSTASDSLANKLSDNRYKEFSKAFGFGDLTGARTGFSFFAEEITSAYNERQFEVAVGNQDETMRLALNADRELEKIASGSASDNGKWYTVLGSAPIRSVMETALGLPSSFASLDLDFQVSELRGRMESFMGDGEVSQLAEPENREKFLQRFLLMSQMQDSTSMSSGQVALTLLQY